MRFDVSWVVYGVIGLNVKWETILRERKMKKEVNNLFWEEIEVDQDFVVRSGITLDRARALVMNYVSPVLESYIKRSKNMKYVREVWVRNCRVSEFWKITTTTEWKPRPQATVHFNVIFKMADGTEIDMGVREHPKINLEDKKVFIFGYYFKKYQSETMTRSVSNWLLSKAKAGQIPETV